MTRSYLRKFSIAYVALATLSAMSQVATARAAASGVDAPKVRTASAETRNANVTSTEALKAAEGLWAYTALLAGKKRESMPLTGVILFKDGVFVQQSIFDGEPFEKQGAMAHAGPYGAGPKGIHMVGQQTIGISPDKEAPLSFRRDTLHDISAKRSGDQLTIVFDTGTVQKFKRIGPGAGQIYPLENGVLAFVDGHFILVEGDEKGAVTGYGKYTHSGTAYDLEVIRWAEARGSEALNQRDVVLKATFDGRTFTLAKGRSFHVLPPKE